MATVAPSLLKWTAFRLSDGAALTDLEGVELVGDLAVQIGQPETANVVLHLTDKTPYDWLFGTLPGGAGLIAWMGDPLNPVIVGGGIVTQRVRSLGPSVQVALATPEAYLEGCQVGSYSQTKTQDLILNDLITQFAAGTNQPAWILNPLTSTGVSATVNYTASANTHVLQAIQALSTQSGTTLEWFCDWVWNLSARTIRPRITYGKRIGQPANPNPNVTVELADCVTATFTEDYSAGKGANSVTAYGAPNSGATSSTVPTATATAPLNGRPVWSYAFTPNQQVSDAPTLANYAAAAAKNLGNGSQALAVTLNQGRLGKQYGIDWFLGDDMGFNFSGTLAFPTPVTGTARVVGVRVNNATVTPILTGVQLS